MGKLPLRRVRQLFLSKHAAEVAVGRIGTGSVSQEELTPSIVSET